MENQTHSGSATGSAVALNSFVEVHDITKNQKYTIRLVTPSEVNVTSKWISVHSPLAKQLIGRRAGDTVTWESPDETSTLRIVRVKER